MRIVQISIGTDRRIGIDENGELWICAGEEEWKPVPFNENYKGYYPYCRFTTVCAAGRSFVVGGLGEDDLPYIFRSLMGDVWESVNMMCGNRITGYRRAEGKIVRILSDDNTRQLFVLCENGELLTLPDCPKCAVLRKVSDEKIIDGSFAKDGMSILILLESGGVKKVSREEVSQVRVSSEFAERKIKEGAALIDLRKMDPDSLGEWLEIQNKDKSIIFLCEYGIRADQAARYARRKGFLHAYSMGGIKLKLY